MNIHDDHDLRRVDGKLYLAESLVSGGEFNWNEENMMNIYDVVLANNQGNGQKVALSVTTGNGENRSVTYSEMFASASLLSDQLLTRGLRKGDRVALIAENSPEWTIAFLAVMKTNCTAVLLDASLAAADLAQQISQSDVRAALLSPRIMKKLSDALPAGLPALDLSHQGESFPDHVGDDLIPATLPPTLDGDEQIAAIIFSSGTTRTAAGIMHSHEALVETTLMCARSNNLTSKGKYLAVVPNSHIYGLICTVLGPMLLCADVHFIELSSAEALVKAFAEYRPTVFPCVPKVFELFKTEISKKIASDPKTKKLFDLFFPICLTLRHKTGINLGKFLFKAIHEGFGGRIEIFCSAGAPMDQKTAEFYIGTGFNMLITYGATETNIPTLGNRGRHLTTNSCGLPYPDVSVKISETGELLIQSPYMMKGYFRDPELTASAFEDGWFKTGDLCQRNEQGDYVIVGRSKENIVLASGKKVIPGDLETAYLGTSGIPGVKELVACGVPVSDSGCDEAHAFIVCQDQTSDTNQILQMVHQRGTELPPFMKIAKIHFVDEIPKTSLQKPKRFLLKKMAQEEAGQTIAAASIADQQVRDSIEQEVVNMIAEVGHFDHSVLTPSAKLFSGLGLDSLNSIELALRIESRYGLRVDHSFRQSMTIADLVSLIKSPDAQSSNAANADDLAMYPRKKRLRDYSLFQSACNLARIFYKITMANEKVIPDDSGFILCANHVSNIDYLWLAMNFKRQRFEKFCCMAKQEIFNKSLASRLLSQVCGMIPVDRANAQVETMKCCQRQLKEKWGLLIHPEGTRSEDGELGVFKKGAAILAIESNVPIIPAYIHGAYDVYPKGHKLPNLFNIRSMKKYAVAVIYGNPIFPANQTADELMQKVKESILELRAACQNQKLQTGQS